MLLLNSHFYHVNLYVVLVKYQNQIKILIIDFFICYYIVYMHV